MSKKTVGLRSLVDELVWHQARQRAERLSVRFSSYVLACLAAEMDDDDPATAALCRVQELEERLARFETGLADTAARVARVEESLARPG